jgi:hypothetical protein
MTDAPTAATNLAAARKRNEEAWDAPPGYTKKRCDDCLFWFATADPATPRCVDCELRRQRRAARIIKELE